MHNEGISELDLLEQALAEAGVDRLSADGIPPLPEGAFMPASLQQERLWLVHQLDPGSAALNMSAALRLTGEMDQAALEWALAQIVRRHGVLRTSFASGARGLEQIVAPAGGFSLAVETVEAQSEKALNEKALLRIRDETTRPFDLGRGPLFRASLLRLGGREHVLVLVLHHVIGDGWSIGIFTRELAALYGAAREGRLAPLAELPASYADYSAWQRGQFEGDRLKLATERWRGRLRGLEPLRLPLDRPRPPQRGLIVGGRHLLSFPRATCAALRLLAESVGATTAQAVLASLQALLARYSGQDDVAVGIPTANRGHADVEGLIGFFVNLLVVRTDCGGRPSFRELVRRVREGVLVAHEDQEVPFQLLVDELQPERRPNLHPFFQVALAYQNAPGGELTLPGLTIGRMDDDQTARFDLEVFLGESEGRLEGAIAYDRRLFDPETISRFARHWGHFLDAALGSPDEPLVLLPLLDQNEKRLALAEGGESTDSCGNGLSLPEWFAMAAGRRPAAPAIVSGDRIWSFAELDARSDAIAACLCARGFGPETVAGIWLERGPELVAAILGILKTGGAYLPLDPSYPSERLHFMIEDSRAAWVLGGPRPSGVAAKRWIDLGAIATGVGKAPPPLRPDPRSLAYIIYTSGSTGRPKGSEITHAGLLNYLRWATAFYDTEKGEGAPLHSSIGFDLTVTSLFPPLLAGRPVVIVSEAAGAGGLAAVLRQGSNASPVKLTPAHLRVLNELMTPEDAAGRARVMVIGGEQLLPEHVAFWRRHAPATRLINEYGPTETVVGCCVHEVTEADLSGPAIPIGRPIAGTRLYVLDPGMELLPVGVEGELWIAGAGVARGYSGRPDLTADRFLPDPWSPETGGRMYRSGDRVKRRLDGVLEYLGRYDDQIKLRGHRIEPGEIESVLARHESVREVAVMLREDHPGDARLAAYIVAEAKSAPLADGLGRWTEEQHDQWRMMFEENYRRPPPGGDAAFNIVGWNSSYDGRPMAQEDIREWRNDTVASLRALDPRRVLEIGCGSGLIVFALAPACEEYLAMDFSQASVDAVDRHAASCGLRQVRTLRREASDFTGVPEGAFDLVILNSVVQYFSHRDHLLAVLRGAVAAVRSGGTVFVGDVRSLPLLPAYHASVQFHRADENVTRRELADRVRRQIEREEELVVDPEFFSDLPRSLPGIAAAEIRPRTYPVVNELTKFRYDVFLRVGFASSPAFSMAPSLAESVAAALEEDRRVLSWIQSGGGPATVGEFRKAVRLVPAGPGLAEPGFAPAISADEWINHPLRSKLSRALGPALRTYLKGRVPAHMVPSAFVLLDRLPLTVNGKVDRRALPPPAEETSEPVATYLAARGPEEAMLAEIWADVLERPRVGVEDNFFDMGGHSLLAAQVVSRVRQVMGIELPLAALFEAPTVAGLAAAIAAGPSGGKEAPPPIESSPRDGPLPLSFSQERLWFLEQLAPGKATYHMPVLLRLEGDLDIRALTRALSELFRRHESLRTAFRSEAGSGVQVVVAAQPVPLLCEDLSMLPEAERYAEAHARASEEAARPFDFSQGVLLRARLYGLGPKEHLLLALTHHIVSDGWSMSVIVRELAALYGAGRRNEPSPLPGLPLQYGDYARWQRGYLCGETLGQKLEFWRQWLADVATLELPADYPRPAILSGRGRQLPFALSAETTERLSVFARERGVTLFMVLLAGFSAWLRRESGQDDIVIGTSVANRQRREIEALIGFFVNTLALRVEAEGNLTFAGLVERVRRSCLEAYAHQEVPFEAVVEAVAPRRDLSRTPLFQVALVLLNTPPADLELDGLRISQEALPAETAKFELLLLLQETPDGLAGTWEYTTDLFSPATVARFGRHFCTLLDGAVANPAALLDDLALASSEEIKGQLKAGIGPEGDCLGSAGVAAAFSKSAAIWASKPALTKGGTTLTYGELNAKANQLAWHLRARGLEREDPVGILMERSPEAIVAMLGVLKAGGYFIPLNPDDPLERIDSLLGEMDPGIVLTQERLADRVPSRIPLILAADGPAQTWAGERSDDPPQWGGPDDLAYVMHTSGSTGAPKGIAVPQRAILRLVNRPNFMSVAEDDVFLQFAPLSFDASVWEIWMPLLNGARLEVAPPGALSLSELGSVMGRAAVTTAWLTAGLFHQMIDHCPDAFGGLRQVVAGGDSLSVDHVGRLAAAWPALRIVNGYGPTENTVFTCCHTVERGASGASVPIGRPIGGTRIAVLDERGEPVPIGVPGELCAGGQGLARGYFGRPAETAEQFVPDPHSREPGARLYRTGDRARWLPGGTIEFLGRLDQQVKLRGFRIELGEIESALRQHPAVRDAVAQVHIVAGDRQLAIHYVLSGPESPAATELRQFLAGRLPGYMVPAHYIALRELPLGRTGKVSRRALHAPEAAADKAGGIGPRTALEARLTRIWEEVLAVAPIGVRDDFFELGGHSLLAMRLLAEVEKRLGTRVSLTALFRDGTIEAMARAIEGGSGAAAFSPLLPLKPEGSKAPFFCVHPGGGSVLSYFALAAAFPADRPFYGLQSPGLDGRVPPLRTVEAIASAYLQEIRAAFPAGPYHLGGHSFGGSVAYEMARQLEAAGGRCGALVLLDHVSPDLARAGIDHEPSEAEALEFTAGQISAHFGREIRLTALEVEPLPEAARLELFLQRACEAGLAPPGADVSMVAGLVAVYQANLHALLGYLPGPLQGGLALLRTAELPTADPLAGWGQLVRGEVRVVPIGGNHNTMLRPPHLEALAGAIVAQLSDD